jgi:hypothetical protein
MTVIAAAIMLCVGAAVLFARLGQEFTPTLDEKKEYQIGCRDSENKDPIIVTAPFNINDKAARVTSSKLAANTQNTTTPEQFAKCAKTWRNR